MEKTDRFSKSGRNACWAQGPVAWYAIHHSDVVQEILDPSRQMHREPEIWNVDCRRPLLDTPDLAVRVLCEMQRTRHSAFPSSFTLQQTTYFVNFHSHNLEAGGTRHGANALTCTSLAFVRNVEDSPDVFTSHSSGYHASSDQFFHDASIASIGSSICQSRFAHSSFEAGKLYAQSHFGWASLPVKPCKKKITF